MYGFKRFVREDGDVKTSLEKLPPKFKELVKGYEFRFEPHNTIYGDDEHVGMIVDKPKKVVRIAAPFHYGREFVLFHEIAHLVYQEYIKGKFLETEWAEICQRTKNKKKGEPPEENFAHAFANFFVKNKIVIHLHKEWDNFIKKICRD